MRQRAVFPALIFFEEPDQRRDKIDGGLDKKVPLLFDPFPVQAEHDGAGGFHRIGDIGHGFGFQRVAAVHDVLEIDHAEFAPAMPQQGIIRDLAEVVIFKVIDEHGKSFGDMLGDEVPDDEIGLARAGAAADQRAAKRIDDIDPAIALLAFELVFSR